MAEMNLRQIVDKLNSEFTGEVRKLVFWYDTNAEFEEDIDTIELENAKVLYLKPDNQFYIKHFLEREDSTTNYLIYAPLLSRTSETITLQIPYYILRSFLPTVLR